MTRRFGRCDPAAPAAPGDHAAWGYSTRSERSRVVTAWLGAGLAAGYRALYVADLSVSELLVEVAGVPGAVNAAASGALTVTPSAEVYDLHHPTDPAAQLAVYAAAVDQALADGFAGLRVAADITPLVADATRRASHLLWEQHVDAYIATRPFAPLCLYDTKRVGGVEAIACVHALQGPAAPHLSVFASGEGRALHGEIDGFRASTIAEVLRHLPDDEVVLDLRGVAFIDAHAAWTLHSELMQLRDTGRAVRISGASSALALVWRACGFDETLPLAS